MRITEAATCIHTLPCVSQVFDAFPPRLIGSLGTLPSKLARLDCLRENTQNCTLPYLYLSTSTNSRVFTIQDSPLLDITSCCLLNTYSDVVLYLGIDNAAPAFCSLLYCAQAHVYSNSLHDICEICQKIMRCRHTWQQYNA